MLIAKNEQGNIIFAEQALRQSIYYCPACRNKVFLKKGKHVIAHYSHYSKNKCASFSEGETLEHLEGKKLLYGWFHNSDFSVELEPYFKEIKQRPDLLLKKDKQQIAIEFQCSPLKEKDFIERTKGYLSKNIKVIWILGNSLFNSNKVISSQTKKFIRNYKSVLFLLNLDTRDQVINIWYQFSSLYRNITYKKIAFKLEEITVSDFDNLSLEANANISEVFNFQYIKKDHEKLTKERNYTRSRFFYELYKTRENLISLPLEVYVYLKDDWMIGERPYTILWKISLLKHIESLEIDSLLTLENIKSIINTMSAKNEIQCLESPLLSKKIKLRPVLQFLRVLEESNCLQSIGPDEWIIRQKARRFQREDEKMKLLSARY